MNFEYNEDQLAIKEMAKNFSETEFKPYASEWDQKEIEHYRDVLREAKKHDLKIVLTLYLVF